MVDDSITSRSLERSILEAHGYRVRVAVDGLEALELLRAEMAIRAPCVIGKPLALTTIATC